MIRTRIAPSPTGDPHLGTAYVALFNYCFARANQGRFVLRIEDTDRARARPGSEANILRSLRWLGLVWDEGPDVGGPYLPYRQSERLDTYASHVGELIRGGRAFVCVCTPERLATLRAEQRARGAAVGYDGHCLHLPPAEIERLRAEGRPFVVRMVVPREGTCMVNDLWRGEVTFDWKSVNMQVLLKSDGMPTYHLANVVDDHLMKITHVIRGEEWLSSAPKHLLLYSYFGWPVPELAHLPLLRNPDRSKLSKRRNPTSLLWYERMGYLPEAVLNYLGRMAWSMPGDEEKFSLDEMIAAFTLDRVSMGAPIFDLQKLDWLSGVWIRETLSDEEFGERVARWALNRDYLAPIIPLVKPRVHRFSDLAPLAAFFVSGDLNVSAEALVDGTMPDDTVRQALGLVLSRVDVLPHWEKPPIEQALRETAGELGVKLRDFLRPFYVAVTGKAASVPLFDAMAILGRDLVRHRLRVALLALGVPPAGGSLGEALAEDDAGAETEP